jgi:DNA-directed RNA polymerase specialized sigma24 family protein
MTLTHHQVVNLVRHRHSRTRCGVTRDGRTGIPNLAPTPEDLVCLDEERSGWRAVLRQLSPAQQEVIVLAHSAGRTQRDIAPRIDAPVGHHEVPHTARLQNLREQCRCGWAAQDYV